MTLKLVKPPAAGPAPGPILGIDLGTTNSLVAVLTDGKPRLLPNALGEVLTPSVVSVAAGGEILVGAAAQARRALHPASTAAAFKRDMGTDRTYQLGTRTFSPQQLSSLVLSSLKADAEAALGERIEEAVITVPAYFDEAQRRATRDAATLAGLHAERIINEPTAAALAYGLHQRTREFKAVVLDLGGGTFDVTVLEVMEGVIEIHATAGDTRLGGEDFAEALALFAAERIGLSGTRNHAPTWARLLGAAEGTKRRLSEHAHATLDVIDLPLPGGDTRTISVPIDRHAAMTAWRPLLERLRAPILRALRDAGQDPQGIDEILLVGGATRMPCVADLAADVFGRAPSRALPPDEAVAMGAAIQAALKARDKAVADMVVTDVAPFSMGLAVANRIGNRTVTGMFSPILERGTVIPASRVESYSPLEDNQTTLTLEIFQGEHSMCQQNRKLGELTLSGLPPRSAGECEVAVRFTYDLNGLLEVEATVVETGKKANVLLEQAPGRLSPAQLAQARAELDKLKFHPRDALPNVTLLERAEAQYVELKGEERGVLGALMAQFRTALETQDPARIEPARRGLAGFLAQFGGPSLKPV